MSGETKAKPTADLESGQDAIWFYARQRNDRCSVHSEEAARGILRQGEEVVYVLR